jgi:hypothetical protein
MTNPPDAWNVRAAGITSFAGFCMMLIAYFASGVTLVLMAGWPVPLLPLLAIWYREYYHRPTSVIVKKDGFAMRFRYIPEESVRWQGVERIEIGEGDDSTPRGRRMKTGVVWLRGKSVPFPMTYELANELWNAYVVDIGPPPSNWRRIRYPRDFP